MSAHQATLDYINQVPQTCSTQEGRERRYEHNRFAEQQGSVNHQWLSLQEALNTQVEFSLRLLLLNTASLLLPGLCCSGGGAGAAAEEQNRVGGPTATDQRLDLRPEPLVGLGRDPQQQGGAPEKHSSLSGQGQRRPPETTSLLQDLLNDSPPSLCLCQELEEQMSQRCGALLELRGISDGGDQESRWSCDRDKTVLACEKLAQQVQESLSLVFDSGTKSQKIQVWPDTRLLLQNQSVKEKLLETRQMWDAVCEQLNHLTLNTARTSQIFRHRHSSPQLWLQAHRDLHQQLQVNLHCRLSSSDLQRCRVSSCPIEGAVTMDITEEWFEVFLSKKPS